MKNRRPDMPEFFDITKYEGAEHFGLAEWASNLIERESELRAAKLFGGRPDKGSDDAKWGATRAELLRRSRIRMQSPLLPTGDRNLDIYGRHEHPGPVAEVTVRYLVQKLRDVLAAPHARGCSDQAEKLLSRGRDLNALSNDPALAQLATQTYRKTVDPTGDYTREDGFISLRVDLVAPLDHLIEEFSSLMQRLRQEVGIENQRRGFDQRSLARWHRTRVLAYIDIWIYSILLGVKYTDYQLGVELFPNEIDLANPAERIRRTVRPLAETLMTVQTTSVLGAQVREATTNRRRRR